MLVAGGSGVIGRPLVSQLVEAGHEVVATTRSPAKAAALSSAGATPLVLDALDIEAVRRAVHEARPEAIIHQLTALPAKYEPTKPEFYADTNRLREETTRQLLGAGQEVGLRRFVFQSICFMYRLEGPMVLDESAPVADAPGTVFGEAVRSTIAGEELALGTGGVDGVVLRYGQLYGPGTYYSRDGDFGQRAHSRMLPVVGHGRGTFSFLHVEDAASAAVAALQRGGGVYNVADDEPAQQREWLPVFCDAIGAPRPWRVPVWLARVIAGSFVVDNVVNGRGATNAKAKEELGWTPSFPTWRTGFYETTAAGSGERAAR